jgi:hypothetical protein
MVYRSTIRKKGFHLFSGVAGVYWIMMISTIFMAGSYFVPQVIRFIILTNAATLLLVWFINCLYLKKIATELNSGLEYYSRTLVEDLTTRPQTDDMFMEEIEKYCKKHNLSIEILEYGLPAKIKMDNTLYSVKLGEYYDIIGALVYTLEFHNIVSKTSTSIN